MLAVMGSRLLMGSGAVLIVEDNARLADLAAATLAAVCTSVVVADSAAKAIALLEERDFDVVVTDFAMPGGDGLSVAHVLRNRTPRPTCLLWSASLPQRVVREAEELGAVVVPKVVGDELRSIVCAAIHAHEHGTDLTRPPLRAPSVRVVRGSAHVSGW